nr:unnamed protein product [Callosobruchus analis]
MGEERLSGLCLLSVHQRLVKANREQHVSNKLAECPTRLLLK